MTENKTPELPHELAKDEDGDTLSAFAVDSRDRLALMATGSSGTQVAIFVDLEALLRSLAQHTPHLRIVDAVEHAPEALEVLVDSLRASDQNDVWHGWKDEAKSALEALAAAGLAVGPAGSGEVSVEEIERVLDEHIHADDISSTPVIAETIHALYAGRAPEADSAEEQAARIRSLELQLGKAEAEVANLRDALEKADALIRAQKNAAMKAAEARRHHEERDSALSWRDRKQAEYDTARQALTEGATSQEGDRG